MITISLPYIVRHYDHTMQDNHIKPLLPSLVGHLSRIIIRCQTIVKPLLPSLCRVLSLDHHTMPDNRVKALLSSPNLAQKYIIAYRDCRQKKIIIRIFREYWDKAMNREVYF